MANQSIVLRGSCGRPERPVAGMSEAREAPGSSSPEFDLGVLFVHGIGAQRRGQTLAEFGGALFERVQDRLLGLDARWRWLLRQKSEGQHAGWRELAEGWASDVLIEEPTIDRQGARGVAAAGLAPAPSGGGLGHDAGGRGHPATAGPAGARPASSPVPARRRTVPDGRDGAVSPCPAPARLGYPLPGRLELTRGRSMSWAK